MGLGRQNGKIVIFFSICVLFVSLTPKALLFQDWRVLPFFVVALFVLLQAWKQPFANRLDNVLEQATLTMLLCVLYADVALTSPTWRPQILKGGEITPNGVMLAFSVGFIGILFVSQRQERKEMQRVHQANFSGMVKQLDQEQQQEKTQEGELSKTTTNDILRRSMLHPAMRTPTDGALPAWKSALSKVGINVWLGKVDAAAVPTSTAGGAPELPEIDFNAIAAQEQEDETEEGRSSPKKHKLSQEEIERVDDLKMKLGISSLEVSRCKCSRSLCVFLHEKPQAAATQTGRRSRRSTPTAAARYLWTSSGRSLRFWANWCRTSSFGGWWRRRTMMRMARLISVSSFR